MTKGKFMMNNWYVAAWSEEVSRTLFAREILGDSILLYRKEDGTAVALSNVCPHRFCPLDQGRLVGDAVECAWHGLQFDGDGRCSKSPHAPAAETCATPAALRTYPLLEKWGALWLWMGQKSPDVALLPDLSWLDQPEHWRPVHGISTANAHYELLTDNLLDLTHLCYVHPNGLGNDPNNVENELVENIQVGRDYWCKRTNYGVVPSADVLFMNPTLKEFPCDKTNNVRWTAPGNVAIIVDYHRSGTEKEQHTGLRIGFMMTPMTASGDRTWQFWTIARNAQRDNPEMDGFIRKAAYVGIDTQDTPMCEQQFAMMNGADFESLELVALPGDITPNRVRKALANMIAAEQRELAETPIGHRLVARMAQAEL